MLLLKCLDYIQRFLKIRDKDSRLIDFILNPPQRCLYETIRKQWQAGKPVRIIILKARQMGFSTLVEAIIFWLVATSFHCEALIVAHTDDATKNLYNMSQRFLDNLPELLKPMQKASNAQELVFDRPTRYRGTRKGLESKIRCATAGGKGIGRSFTLRALHLSEFAFWPNNKLDTLTGLLQAVPDKPGTIVVIESTANGYDEFKKQWDRAVAAERAGSEGFIPIFFAWYEMPEYRRPVPPGFVRTEEEERLANTFFLDDEQLVWRRWAIENNCGGDIEKFHQEYPSTPDEAFISTGACIFEKERLVLRRKQAEKLPWERGMFRLEYNIFGKIEKWSWEPDKNGPVRILQHPQERVPYVFGGDTAGTGSDYFAGHILDNQTGKQVAVIHHQFGERAFAEQVYALGMYYNKALLGIETNYSTYPQMLLEELRYPNFYVRKQYDNFTGKILNAYGFETTPVTRPILVGMVKDVAHKAIETITDYETLGEMLTFVNNKFFKPEAENGEHDDLVISFGIAQMIRGQQTTDLLPLPTGKPEQSGWTQDQWEDWNRASPKEREYLLHLWGSPT